MLNTVDDPYYVSFYDPIIHVALAGVMAQIYEPIKTFVIVVVTNLHPLWRGAEERQRDKAVNIIVHVFGAKMRCFVPIPKRELL